MKRRKIKEFIEKAREAGSAEELLSLARENNIEMTEELDNVAGGGCYGEIWDICSPCITCRYEQSLTAS